MPLAHALARVVQPQRRRRSERDRVGDESSQLRRGAPPMADLRGLKFEILEFFLSQLLSSTSSMTASRYALINNTEV